MSASEQPPAGAAPPREPTEEELRAAYEAELGRISTTDMIAQAAISLLNLGARRLAAGGEDPAAPPGSERDLEQARDAIDAAGALIEILDRRIPRELAPLRDALSRLQMAYAAEVNRAPEPQEGPGDGGAGGEGEDGGEGEGGAGGSPAAGEQPGGEQPRRPGPAESSGRLWVPGR